MAGPSYGSQTQVSAVNLAVEITTDVNSALMEVKYPDLDWRKVLKEDQIITNINPGALNYGYFIADMQGAAAFQSGKGGKNVPKVNVSNGMATIPLAASAVSAEVTNEDARQYSMGFRQDLASQLGKAMKKACENLVETTVFYGDASVGFRGFLSYTGVNAAVAAGNDPANEESPTEWASKTGIQMVADINAAISYVIDSTLTVHKPGFVGLPVTQFLLLSNTFMALGENATMVSALTYLKVNNSYTALTGKELQVVPIRYLKGAGVNGTDRMVIMDQDKENQCLPVPMPYTLCPSVPILLGAEFAAEQKHGSFAVARPGSMLYVDGI
jgi:hypothetical protein